MSVLFAKTNKAFQIKLQVSVHRIKESAKHYSDCLLLFFFFWVVTFQTASTSFFLFHRLSSLHLTFHLFFSLLLKRQLMIHYLHFPFLCMIHGLLTSLPFNTQYHHLMSLPHIPGALIVAILLLWAIWISEFRCVTCFDQGLLPEILCLIPWRVDLSIKQLKFKF